MASPTAARVQARAQTDRAFLKRALSNPGLRSKLSDTQLRAAPGGAKLVAARAQAQRFKQPVTPGSSMTEGDLARAAKAYGTSAYGGQETALRQQLGTSQQAERDTGSYYDNYLNQLAQYSRDVANIQQGVQIGLAGLAGAQQPALQSAQGVQQAAGADAAARGTQAADVTGLAQQAAAARQNVIGSFQAQQQLVGGTEQNYASGLANIVGPQQKLAAQDIARKRTANVQEKQTELAAQKGAAVEKYKADTRASEAKNVLATAAVTGSIGGQPTLAATKEAATEAAGRATRREARKQHGISNELARTRIHDARVKAKAQAQAALSKRAQTGPFAGKTQKQINDLSDADAQALVDAYNQNKGTMSKKEQDAFYQNYGVKPQGTAAVAKGRDTVTSVQNIIGRQGLPKTKANYDQLFKTLVAGQTADKKKKVAGIAKQNPLWTRVALDYWLYGGVTNSTADKLHHAGYSVKTLGYKPAPSTTQRNTSAYGSSSPQPQGHY